MISLTHFVFGLSLAYVLDKRLVTASAFAIVPGFDLAFNFLYPFVENGIMHSFLAASVFGFLTFLYTEDRVSTESCLLGYSSALLLDLLTKKGAPLFFPLFKRFSLGLTSFNSFIWNSAIITFSISLILLKKHELFSFGLPSLR